MTQRDLTARHEAGHIVIAAITGKCVKLAHILGATGFTDYFLKDEPMTPPSPSIGTVKGGFDWFAFNRQQSSPISEEEAILAAYKGWPLKDSILSLVAGYEAELVYKQQHGEEMPPINGKIDDPGSRNDVEVIDLLIRDAGEQEERTLLIRQARERARTLLRKPHVWEAVCIYVQLLLEYSSIHWYILEKEKKEPIEQFLARGEAYDD